MLLFRIAIGSIALLLASCGGGGSDQAPDASPAALVIHEQPADTVVSSGDAATFSVKATGTGTLTYQWLRDGVPQSGADQAQYVLAPAAPADHGASFSVQVSDSQATQTSAAATLSVTAPAAAPAIVTQPADQAALDGAVVTFSVEASGATPLSYSWQRDGQTLPAETGDKLTLRVSVADNGSRFVAIVTNGNGTVASNPATLTVSVAPIPPVFTSLPSGVSVVAPATATFSAVASGTAPLAYQWRRNGVPIAGANAASYTTPATTVDDSGQVFTLSVSNSAGTVTSSAAVLTVNAAPVAPAVVSQPSPAAVVAPAAATFSVLATGTAPLSYQWRRNGVPIAGANASTYATPPTSVADHGNVFTLSISNVAGTVVSSPATLSVTAAPTAPAVTTQPADVSVAQGQTVTFSVTASGTAPLAYQWRRNGVNVAGANAGSYTTAATTVAADNGVRYDVVVSNAAGAVASRLATLTVTAPASYLQGLLDSIPAGGWVQVNANFFSDAWPTGADQAPPTPSNPYSIIPAWSGFAWDSRRSQLILFGGGHANYVGNEIYVWRGSDGRWTRGSLPSRVDLSTGLVAGDGAPQSSHTYQTNSYAPLVDRFVIFGGAAWNSGGPLVNASGRTGPWWWDPTKADASKVGGQSGTGWDAARAGNQAWLMRADFPWMGNALGPNFVNGTSAYREENGKDVIYVTMDSNASGWPSLYRYQLGTPTTPDVFEQVGSPSGAAVMYIGSAAIDSRNGLFVRTALGQGGGSANADLAVWRLANNNASSPGSNRDVGVRLVEAGGAAVDISGGASMAYDPVNDQFVIWDGLDRGTVWTTRAAFNADGSIAPVWTVTRVASTTASQPLGNHVNAVLGKWKYAPELRAFVALDSTPNTGDVWLYKPLSR